MFNIRPAKKSDATAILGFARSFATSYDVEADSFQRSFVEILASPDAYVAVALVEDHVVGYILGFIHYTFYANGRVGWVEEIMVDEAVRRRGMGRELMENFELWAEARQCKLIALATRRAAPFYISLGYEESATYFRKKLA
jgi:GNAT superfamily N-acetyltransferase